MEALLFSGCTLSDAICEGNGVGKRPSPTPTVFSLGFMAYATDDGLIVGPCASTAVLLSSLAWLEGGLDWPKTVCAVTGVLGLPLVSVGVLPSVSVWLFIGEARLGASSLLRAVPVPC